MQHHLGGYSIGGHDCGNNMSALNTLNTINKNQTPQGRDSALERLAKEIGAGIWDNTDWDDPAFQQNIKQLGITVLNKDTQPPEAFIGDAIFDHLGDTEFNAPEMNGNLLILGGLNANLPSGKSTACMCCRTRTCG